VLNFVGLWPSSDIRARLIPLFNAPRLTHLLSSRPIGQTVARRRRALRPTSHILEMLDLYCSGHNVGHLAHGSRMRKRVINPMWEDDSIFLLVPGLLNRLEDEADTAF
jgi:hypothetical protein